MTPCFKVWPQAGSMLHQTRYPGVLIALHSYTCRWYMVVVISSISRCRVYLTATVSHLQEQPKVKAVWFCFSQSCRRPGLTVCDELPAITPVRLLVWCSMSLDEPKLSHSIVSLSMCEGGNTCMTADTWLALSTFKQRWWKPEKMVQTHFPHLPTENTAGHETKFIYGRPHSRQCASMKSGNEFDSWCAWFAKCVLRKHRHY